MRKILFILLFIPFILKAQNTITLPGGTIPSTPTFRLLNPTDTLSRQLWLNFGTTYGYQWFYSGTVIQQKLNLKINKSDTTSLFVPFLRKSNNLSDVANAATALSNLNGVSLLGSYSNPAWITALAWSKITSIPTTVAGYGITDVYTKIQSDGLYVPYTGATTDVDLGINGFYAGSSSIGGSWGGLASAGLFYNTNSAGTGLDITGGSASTFALRVRNYNNTTTAMNLLGNGNVIFGGTLISQTPLGTAGTDSLVVKVGSTKKYGAISANYYYPRTHIDSVVAGLIPIALINGITKNYYDPTSSIQGQLNYKLNINGSNANQDVNIYNNSYKTTKGILMDTTFVDGSNAYLEANKTDFLYDLFKPSTYDMSMYLTHNSVNMSYTETIGANTFAYNLNAQNHRVALDYNKNSLYSYFSIDTLGLHVKDTTYQRGPVGTAYYGANYTDNTYVQKKYVVDNFPHSVFMTPASGDLLKFNGTNWVNYAFTANSPLTYNSGLATVAIQMAGASQPGYISTVDWNTFNGKLSTTGNGSGLTNLTAANISAGTAGINITGNAATASNSINSNALNGFSANFQATTSSPDFLVTRTGGSSGSLSLVSSATVQTWLGLGSNAYTSTAYLPSSGFTTSAINTLYGYTPANSAYVPIHGNYTNTLTGATVINVTIGSTMGNSSYYTSITPRDLITAVNYYISAQTTTSFAVTFISALTGSVSFDWNVIP